MSDTTTPLEQFCATKASFEVIARNALVTDGFMQDVQMMEAELVNFFLISDASTNINVISIHRRKSSLWQKLPGSQVPTLS
jgi:hypothetical protein